MAATMSDEGYPSSWENADSDHPASNSGHGYRMPPTQAYYSRESLDVPLTPSKSVSPPRASAESPTTPAILRWRDSSLPTAAVVPNGSTADTDTLADSSFDENVLRALCDLDCGVPLLLDRIKQSVVSCKEVSTFLKKRAALEEEYGRNMLKLAKATSEAYTMNDGKAGSFVNAWRTSLKLHENVADSRLAYAKNLNEMSNELLEIISKTEQTRKSTKELAGRYERALQDAESATEKSKNRVEITGEELERVLLQKEGESMRDAAVQVRSPGGMGGGKRVIGKAVAKGGLLLKGKNPQNIQRQEDDIRARMSAASDAYRKNVTDTQAIRQEYFNFQLPRILRALQQCANDIDLGTQYHLIRYAFLYERSVLNDGNTLAPTTDDTPGLKAIIESIDNRSDFKTYMQNYAFAHGGANSRGPKREGPREDGYLPTLSAMAAVHHPASSPGASHSQMADKGRPTFGVDLAEQMIRDDVDVPPIVVKCCEAIEKYGLNYQGIYRIGGTLVKVKELKEKLDRDLDSVNLDAEEWSSDISVVTSVLKQWLRELPNPLMTDELHEAFLEAARNDNERLRHIRLHERINELPDPNYATVKYFMGHLHTIAHHEADNAMSVQNLAIVFGPTLFKQASTGANGQITGMADAPFQNKAIETILEHYKDIFVDEEQGQEQ
ncbi:RhoGAP-domain-containing protein [Trametopsis cervina]|nr:RhoGAP-domain-containing protein [Trametopsis cervina]